jgi:hypothetical protein
MRQAPPEIASESDLGSWHTFDLPGIRPGKKIGLGQFIKRVTGVLGVEPCGPCARRAALLDKLFAFAGSPALASTSCWRFTGRCTGFGSRQCVTGPAAQTPDAVTIEHCCSGWFQYPWIEVCPGQSATTGCGFCFW